MTAVRALLVFLLLISSPCFAGDYRLSDGDTLRIYVLGEEELSMDTKITNEGSIFYPFLGEIEVKGLTLSELEQQLTNKLSGDYLVNPKVSVTIVSYQQFFIEGAVKSPGGYPFEEKLTVRQAIALAGGFTELASHSRIYIIRAADPNKDKKKIKMNEVIQPGDIITIDESFF